MAATLTNSASTVVCIVQPPDWRIYITPALVAVSALIAFLAMLNTRAVARQKATLDLIEKTESTDHYRHLHATFARVRSENGWGKLANPIGDKDLSDRKAVMDYLNHYELMSIGILDNILDEKFYREWMRGPFVRDWNAASGLIQRQRWKQNDDGSWEYHRQTFEHYQQVACRWSRETVYLTEESGDPPSADEAGGPGDEPLPAPKRSDEDPIAPQTPG